MHVNDAIIEKITKDYLSMVSYIYVYISGSALKYSIFYSGWTIYLLTVHLTLFSCNVMGCSAASQWWLEILYTFFDFSYRICCWFLTGKLGTYLEANSSSSILQNIASDHATGLVNI